MPITIDPEKCDACLKCAAVCPSDAIEKANDGTKDHAKVVDEKCIDCNLCVPECQTNALQPA